MVEGFGNIPPGSPRSAAKLQYAQPSRSVLEVLIGTWQAPLPLSIRNGLCGFITEISRCYSGDAYISTAFAESTVNLVVGKRFAKKQQMQWSKAGAHLLLQTRTKTLDGTLPETFRRWYPAMAANDTTMPAVAA